MISPPVAVLSMAIAPTGHGAKQAPHPVHRSAATLGGLMVPEAGAKTMASYSQYSAHVRQSTLLCERQSPLIRAFKAQGKPDGVRVKTSREQLSTQAPQKLHPPRERSTCGQPSASRTRILLSQRVRQLPHPSHFICRDRASRTQGGGNRDWREEDVVATELVAFPSQFALRRNSKHLLAKKDVRFMKDCTFFVMTGCTNLVPKPDTGL